MFVNERSIKMSRYIDADAVKNIIRSGVSTDTEADQEYVCECIDEASSIEIIRCGECKYWKSTVQMPNGTEVKCLYGRKDDDFCSYGERGGE